MIGNFSALLEAAQRIKNKTTVVVFPANEETFSAVEQACQMGLSRFLLVGDKNIIGPRFKECEHASAIDIVHEETPAAALQRAGALVGAGKGDILMKGAIDTSTMMKYALKEETGLRPGRLL